MVSLFLGHFSISIKKSRKKRRIFLVMTIESFLLFALNFSAILCSFIPRLKKFSLWDRENYSFYPSLRPMVPTPFVQTQTLTFVTEKWYVSWFCANEIPHYFWLNEQNNSTFVGDRNIRKFSIAFTLYIILITLNKSLLWAKFSII